MHGDTQRSAQSFFLMLPELFMRKLKIVASLRRCEQSFVNIVDLRIFIRQSAVKSHQFDRAFAGGLFSANFANQKKTTSR